jgi:diguanylate cyclase (GGDEF)-like protein
MMKLQTKLSFAVLPMVAIIIIALGTMSIWTTTKAIQTNIYNNVEADLHNFIQHNIAELHRLLTEQGLSNIESFVDRYQEESIAAIHTKHQSNGYILIFESDNQLRYTNNTLSNINTKQWIPVAQGISNEPGYYHRGSMDSKSGREIYIGYHFTPWAWTILYVLSAEELLAPEKNIRNATIVATLVCILIGFGLIFSTLKRLVINPISQLHDASESIASLKKPFQIDIQSSNEIGALARQMESMSQSIYAYKVEKEGWQKQLEATVEKRTSKLEIANKSLQKEIKRRKTIETSLRENEELLKKNVTELEKANIQIIKQQKALVEDERLKVLLQMAGATAHELSQPLMIMLGYIQLMEMHKGHPEKLNSSIKKIEESGNRIANIVKKIQTIRYYEVKPYSGQTDIVELNQPLNILHVEDNEKDHQKVKFLLEQDPNISIFYAPDLGDAFQIIKTERIDLILLDYILPSGNGIQFITELEEKEIEIPTVMVTGEGDEVIASQVIQIGAYDYLPKTKISSQSLSRAITNAMEKNRLKGEVKNAMKKMAEMSTRDELTGLYNRRYFVDMLDRGLAEADRYTKDLVLCIFDLDHFKKVNDTYGHPAGDKVLIEVSKALNNCIRKSDIPCRYGGEEFAVLFPSTKLADAQSFCERFRRKIEDLVVPYESSEIRITVSIGVAKYVHSKNESPEDLIKRTDKALYMAKEQGRNRVLTDSF